MPLTPGKKYFIEASKEKIAKRDVSDDNSIPTAQPDDAFYTPKIDYVIAEGQAYTSTRDATQKKHADLSFVGANRIIKDDAKYSEVYEEIKNNQIYKIGSEAQVSYTHNHLSDDGTGALATTTRIYKHGDLIETDNRGQQNWEELSSEQVVTTIKGDPIFIEIALDGNTLESGRYYVVFASDSYGWTHGIKYKGVQYFPGDIIEGDGGQFQVYERQNPSDDPDWHSFSPQGADIHNNVNKCFAIDIERLNSYTATDTLINNRAYLLLGRGDHSYGSQTINTAPQIRNIFQYKTSNGITWNDGGSDVTRKYPLIKEIAKSGDLVRGVKYDVVKDHASDREVFVKYDGSYFKAGESFVGRFGQPKYSVIEKPEYSDGTDISNKDIDPASPTPNHPYDNIDRGSGNPFLIKSESIGLQVGKEYVLVSESGTATIELTGATSSDKIQLNGAAEKDYTSTLLQTSTQLKFKISTSSNVRFYWTGANAKVYPVVTELSDHSEVGVYSQGDGQVLYPKRKLYNICVGNGLNPDKYGKKTTAEIAAGDSQVTSCATDGGTWVPQERDFRETASKSYRNRETFNVAGGTCSDPLFNLNEVACKENGGTFTLDSTYDVIADSLFTYRTHLNDIEQDYPIKIDLKSNEPASGAYKAIIVSALTTRLVVGDCIIFNNGEAYFIVGEDQDWENNESFPDKTSGNYYGIGETEIDGSYYGKPLDGENNTVNGVLAIQPNIIDDTQTNPFGNFYVEGSSDEGDAIVGSVLINKSFAHGTRFVGFSEYKYIRAYSTSSDADDTVEAYQKVKVHKVSTTTAANSVAYTVGGGYITFNNTKYHGAGAGRVVISHPANVDGALDYKTVEELFSEGGYYLFKGSNDDPNEIGVEPLPTHIPKGQVIVFPNAILTVTHDAKKGDTVLKGKIGSDYIEGEVDSTIYHKDESFYYSFDAQTIKGDGTDITIEDNSFIYQTTAETWVAGSNENKDGEEIDPSVDPEGTTGYRSLIEVSDGQEYFIQVDETEVVSDLTSGEIYNVKADGSLVEIASEEVIQYSTELENSVISLTVKALPHNLASGTELVFYPAHPNRKFRVLTEEEENEENEYPSDWWAEASSIRRFVLTQSASKNATTITGTTTGTLGKGARAEIFREVSYGGKIYKAGQSFTATSATKQDSFNSGTNVYNSTKAEKIIARHELVDYFEAKDIVKDQFFNIEASDSGQEGEITGSQTRTNTGFKRIFLPKFGMLRKNSGIKVYKVEQIYLDGLTDINNATASTKYTQSVHEQNKIKIKVGGSGAGKISVEDEAEPTSIGGEVEFTTDTDVTLSPSLPCIYQKNTETGFEDGKFYYIESTDDDYTSTIIYHKILKTNGERYYPYLDNSEKHLESFVFGRTFTPILENKLRSDTYLDDIKLLKVSNGKYTEDTTIINSSRYFSLPQFTFDYYITLVNKKYNNKWSGWEVLNKRAPWFPEKKLSSENQHKIRVYDGSDLSSDYDDLKFQVISSKESYYTANYPDLINVIEEKRPNLVNALEDQQLYMVESGAIIYAGYGGGGSTDDDIYGFVCDDDPTEEDSTISGEYDTNKFFYGKTDAWGTNVKLTGDIGGSSDLVNKFGNFDEFHVAPDQTAHEYLVSTCYEPWEIEADKVYTVRCHSNEAIEYNGRVYENGSSVTGKHIYSSTSVLMESTMKALMTTSEFEIARKSSVQPWMFSDGAPVSREKGYKRLAPLLYIDRDSDPSDPYTTENGKKYVTSSDIAYPKNEFIGTTVTSWSEAGSPVVVQKIEDGQNIIPGQTYFLYGQGKVKYPYAVKVTGTNASGIIVEALPQAIESGTILTFNNGAEFIVTVDAAESATSLKGKILRGSISANKYSPIIKNIYGTVKVEADGDITSSNQVNQTNLRVKSLPQDLFKGEVLKFDSRYILVLTENARQGDLSITVETAGTVAIKAGMQASLVDYKQLQLNTINAGNSVSGTPQNSFIGLQGFSRIGDKVGEVELFTAASSAVTGFLYKVFGTGSVTYDGSTYNASNVWYGDGSSISGSVKEIIAPEDVEVGMTVYAYGRPGEDLFEYLDDDTRKQLKSGESITWAATHSDLKIYTIPFTKNQFGFTNNKPTISSSRVYGIEPGVRYIVRSNDEKTGGASRRGIVKYARSSGSCKQRNGNALQNEKYKTRNDCIRRDTITIDFDGVDGGLAQNSDQESIEYGDYKTSGVKAKIQVDYLNQYDDNIVLRSGQELIFSRGGRFKLSEDVNLDSEAVEDDGFYYVTIKGVVPFGNSLHNYEFAPLLEWVASTEDEYFSSDNTLPDSLSPLKTAEANGNIQADVTYTVEAGIEIYYNGFEIDGTTPKTVHGLGEQFKGSTETHWNYTSNSNKFEFITRTDKANNEFVGVEGRPYLEIVEGNPKIYEKKEFIDAGSYTVAGEDTLYHSSYFECDSVGSITPESEKYLTGSYSFGILYGENGATDFAADSGGDAWVYSSDKIDPNTERDLHQENGDASRATFSPASGITEAEDFVNFDSSSVYQIINGTDPQEAREISNYYAVTEVHVGFLHNKDADHFPEIVSEGLTYAETRRSKLIDLSFDRHGKNESVVFGAGEFASHYDGDNDFFETTKYKAFGNLSNSSSATQGKGVSSLEESFMYKVKTGPIDYRDKLLIIDDENGYSSTSHGTIHEIKIRKEAKQAPTIPNSSIIVFESKITATSASAGTSISVDALPVSIKAGEKLFFRGGKAKGNYENGKYYYTEDTGLFGTYGYTRVFRSDNTNPILESTTVYNTITFTVSENAPAGATSIKGTSESIDSGSICYREVAIKLTSEFTSGYISGKISDPLYITDTTDPALQIRTLDYGQIASKAFNSSRVEQKSYIYSSYNTGDRFKAASDENWRGSGAVEYTNVMNRSADLFNTNGYTSIDIYGEYIHGHPKVLYVAFQYENTLDTDFNLQNSAEENGQIHLYDLNYSSSTRFKIRDNTQNYSQEGKNNFFVVDGSAATLLNDDTFLLKPVMSGELVSGKDYIVYGVGSITYNNEVINASTDFEETSFTADSETEFTDQPSTRRQFGYGSLSKNAIGVKGATGIPEKEAIYFLGRPIVYQKLSLNDISGLSSGDIVYVFGAGTVKYGEKLIYATNQYLAMSSDTSETKSPKLINSGAISYASRRIGNIGDLHSLSPVIISPVRNVYGFIDYINIGKILNVDGKANTAGSIKTFIHRKLNSQESIQESKRYFVLGRSGFVTYNSYKYYPRGLGRADIITSGDVGVDTITYSSGTVSTNTNFNSVEKGDVFWASYQVNGEQVVVPREVDEVDGADITLSSSLPSGAPSALNSYYQVSVPKDQSNYATRGASGKAKNSGAVTFDKSHRFLMKRNSLFRKGAHGGIRVDKVESTVQRSTSETYGSKFGYTGEYQDKNIPSGFVYIVRGQGQIIYPVFQGDKSSDSDYTLVYGTGSSNGDWYFHNTLSKRLSAGKKFLAIETAPNGGNSAEYYWKVTGKERVHRISSSYEKLTEKINSMDQFLDMGPSKYGVNSGEIRYGRSYKVFWVDDNGKVTDKLTDQENQYIEYKEDIEEEQTVRIPDVEQGTKDVKVKVKTGNFRDKKYYVGETFTGLIDKKDTTVKGNQKVFSTFKPSNKDKIIVRPVEGIVSTASPGGWTNQWSMFMTFTHHHPSRTSMWHHDYYGDMISFLNNRCHIMSEDFKLNKYSHLLQTFSYGKKPVIRSEAPPGYQYLEGSNADAFWFWFGLDRDKANEWYYSSCQIYKPDYQISSIKQKDIEEILEDNNLELGSIMDQNADGICAGVRKRESGGSSDKTTSPEDEDNCILSGGKWIKLKDQVVVTLDRRLTYAPKAEWSKHIGKKLSSFVLDDPSSAKKLWERMAPGIEAPEPYRTDENGIIEYIIREKYNTKMERGYCRGVAKNIFNEEDCVSAGGEWISAGPEDSNGNISMERVKLQCHKARIGDSAPDTFVWHLPDDPFGACEPRFYFTKHIPFAYDNDTPEEPWLKTPVVVDPFIQMELYLRGFCSGFIDKKSDPRQEEINEVKDKNGKMKRLDPTCEKSKDYDYLFENLSFQALDDEGYTEEDSDVTSNFKSILTDYDDIDIKRFTDYEVVRKIDLTKLPDCGVYGVQGGKGWIIYRKYNEKIDGEEAKTLIIKGQEVVRVGALQAVGYNSDGEYNGRPKYNTYKDKYTIPVRDKETLGSVEKNYTTSYYFADTKDFVNLPSNVNISTYISPEGDLSVIRSYQGEATISFEADEGAKYYAIESKRTVLPHETEWKEYDEEIEPRTRDLRQLLTNKNIKPTDRPPKGYFDLVDLDLNTAESDDDAYTGVERVFHIRVRPYYKQLAFGSCSNSEYTTKLSCLQNGNTWTAFTSQTDESTDEIDRTRKVNALIKGYANPISITEDSEISKGSVGEIKSSENGIFTLRLKNLTPQAFQTDAYYANVETEVVNVNGVPRTIKKLYYAVEYKIEYKYKKAKEDDSSILRRGEWQNVKTYRDVKKGQTFKYIDREKHEFATINYRVTKLQSRTGGSRWISPLNLVDELTGFPDDIKGFGPLPNIKLRASLFNQFANAINLLNEARVDLPITIKYRYHALEVAKPSNVAPYEDLGIYHLNFGELNVPAPTYGNFCRTGFCAHPVSVGGNMHADRYEYVIPDWGANVIEKDAWGRELTFVSEWYESAGHTYFQADKNYGFRGNALLTSSNYDEGFGASFAVGGTQLDVELTVNGNQRAFGFAVPRMIRSRIDTDNIILSGRMDTFNMSHPTITGLKDGYWQTRDDNYTAPVGEEKDLPYYCGMNDSTGFGQRPHSAYHFLKMKSYYGGQRYIKFNEVNVEETFCKDIKGRFMLEAPDLNETYAGIITVPHGIEYQHYCLPGGSQSRKIFTTRASTGDNNLRMAIPVVDKMKYHAHWKYSRRDTDLQVQQNKIVQASTDNKDKAPKEDVGE